MPPNLLHPVGTPRPGTGLAHFHVPSTVGAQGIFAEEINACSECSMEQLAAPGGMAGWRGEGLRDHEL